MNRQSGIARKHKSRPGSMEVKLSLTIRPVFTATQTVDKVTGQHQDKGSAAAVESD